MKFFMQIFHWNIVGIYLDGFTDNNFQTFQVLGKFHKIIYLLHSHQNGSFWNFFVDVWPNHDPENSKLPLFQNFIYLYMYHLFFNGHDNFYKFAGISSKLIHKISGRRYSSTSLYWAKSGKEVNMRSGYEKKKSALTF